MFIVRSLATLVTNSLTRSCLVDLTDVTLSLEDANSKLLDIVNVADVYAEERLVEILKLMFEVR